MPVVVVVVLYCSQSIELAYGLPTRLNPRTAEFVPVPVPVYPKWAEVGVYQSCTISCPWFNWPVVVVVTVTGTYVVTVSAATVADARFPLKKNITPLPTGILKVPAVPAPVTE